MFAALVQQSEWSVTAQGAFNTPPQYRRNEAHRSQPLAFSFLASIANVPSLHGSLCRIRITLDVEYSPGRFDSVDDRQTAFAHSDHSVRKKEVSMEPDATSESVVVY